MSVPKSVHKISKGNVEYISSCDFAAYSIKELTRAALRDVGKFVCNNLYFHLLENFQDKTLFIHIPDCYNDENEYK